MLKQIEVLVRSVVYTRREHLHILRYFEALILTSTASPLLDNSMDLEFYLITCH
jgi:hypothetical protein